MKIWVKAKDKGEAFIVQLAIKKGVKPDKEAIKKKFENLGCTDVEVLENKPK